MLSHQLVEREGGRGDTVILSNATRCIIGNL